MMKIAKFSLAVLTCVGVLTNQFSGTVYAKTHDISLKNSRQSWLASKEGDELRAKIISIGKQSTCAGVIGKCANFANFLKAEMIKQKIPGKHILMENSVKTGAYGRIYHI